MSQNESEMDEEFEELKARWEKFISRFESIAPGVHQFKDNVFFHMVDENRPREAFVQMARDTRPFLSKELWDLLENFMEFMKNLPNPEGANYQIIYDGMTPADFVKRLLTKRPIVFVNPNDAHVLRRNPLKMEPYGWKFETLASTLDKVDDVFPYLSEYISYDEMLVSACVSMSTPTFYISDGSSCSLERKTTKPFIHQGILCGLVGARLPKYGFMESRFVFPRDDSLIKSIATQKPSMMERIRNTMQKSSVFHKVHHSDEFWIKNIHQDAFPEGKIPTKEDIQAKPELYSEIYVGGINVVYFKKRLAMSIIPFIQEAISRGTERNEQVVAVVPPIGAGVWKAGVAFNTITNLIAQGVLEFLDSENFDAQHLQHLAAIFLPKTDSVIYSSFVPKNKISTITCVEDDKFEITFNNKSEKVLTIFNQSRLVASPLPPPFENCLSIAGYAWDSNSFPGNEYWVDSFYSFDPQAILCSCLGQFQNPEVNPKLADPERIRAY